MGALSRYQKIYRLPSPGSPPSSLLRGYEYWQSPQAVEAYSNVLGRLSNKAAIQQCDSEVQSTLLSVIGKPDEACETQAQAALCLRCYVSPAILGACKELASAFSTSSNRPNVLADLLSVVLDDDGTTLVVFSEKDDKQAYLIDSSGQLQPAAYTFFSLEVLRRYEHGATNHKSLYNWAYYVTRYHNRVKSVLADVGFKRLTDWALMCKARPVQLDCLSDRARCLVDVFHGVYRRDRLQQRQQTGSNPRGKKSPDPTLEQLQEMLAQLTAHGIKLQSPNDLLKALRQVAGELQDIDLWMRQGRPATEPLELPDPETDMLTPRRDISSVVTNDPEDIERQGMLAYLEAQQTQSLQTGIQQGIEDRLAELQNSRRKVHAPKLLPGLRLVYLEGLSQRDIFQRLGFPNQSASSRVISPKDLIYQVRFRTIEKLLNSILARAQELGLTAIPPQPDYLSNLMSQLEALVDEQIFAEALQELQNPGRERSFKSLYAQAIRDYLENL